MHYMQYLEKVKYESYSRESEPSELREGSSVVQYSSPPSPINHQQRYSSHVTQLAPITSEITHTQQRRGYVATTINKRQQTTSRVPTIATKIKRAQRVKSRGKIYLILLFNFLIKLSAFFNLLQEFIAKV
jgi:hypothetical protein